LVGRSVALWLLGVMRGKIRGRGEVIALGVACTDQTDTHIEIQREIDGERARWSGDIAQMWPECKRTTTAKLNDYRSADFDFTSGYRFEQSISKTGYRFTTLLVISF